MRRILEAVFIVGLLVEGASPRVAAAGLRAGVGKVEITPPAEGTYLQGYAARTSPSVGVFDPLYARALVLDDGKKRMALVALDLCVFRSERVAKEAKDRFGIDLVLMNCSHTHTGPTFVEKRWKDPDACIALKRKTEDLILDAIEKARSAMFPARLAVARGDITLGYHRLVLRPDGRRTPLWRNTERIPIGPVDPTVGIVRVEDAEAATTRALVVNYACHPVCLGSKCRSISADYVGGMTAKIESGLKPGVVCLFAQGAAGDINPNFRSADDMEFEEAWKQARKMGEFLADEVLRALATARPVAGPDELQWRTHTTTFANRWESTETVPVAAATLMVNRTIGIAAIPGEPFVKLQTDFTSQAPVEFPLFFGYTTHGSPDWPGYIPDVRAAAEGGYGASYTTRIELGAAERIVTRAVIDLFDMKGMFFDKPRK